MKATLTIETIPGQRFKRIVVDCPHGTTTVLTLAGAAVVPDALTVAIALQRHRAEQPGCRCVRYLEKRYGLRGKQVAV